MHLHRGRVHQRGETANANCELNSIYRPKCIRCVILHKYTCITRIIPSGAVLHILFHRELSFFFLIQTLCLMNLILSCVINERR